MLTAVELDDRDRATTVVVLGGDTTSVVAAVPGGRDGARWWMLLKISGDLMEECQSVRRLHALNRLNS